VKDLILAEGKNSEVKLLTELSSVFEKAAGLSEVEKGQEEQDISLHGFAKALGKSNSKESAIELFLRLARQLDTD